MIIAFLRTIILYLLIITGIRLMGKRQVGELEPSELVLALIIADLAAVPMQDLGIPLLSGVVPIFTLLSLTMVISVLNMKSIRFRALLCGRPSIVMENGLVIEHELRRNRITLDELTEELRLKGILDLSTVKYAILETNGQLSVLPRAEEQPVTVKQMNKQAEGPGLPLPVINDGRIMERNLQVRGLSMDWLHQKMAEHSITNPEDVFLLSVDELGQVYFVAKEVRKS